MTGFDPSRGGTLGETPILWRFRMQYAWDEQVAQDEPDWDQCCGCAEFAISEVEARRKIWSHFSYWGCIVPVSIASCEPERYENEHHCRATDARFRWSICRREGGGMTAIAMRCWHEDAKRLSPEGVAARTCKASPNLNSPTPRTD